MPDRVSDVASSASLIWPRYLMPCRMPNDSASAPMFAASQKWPSGRFGSSAIAVRAAAMPRFERRLALGLGQAIGAQPVARLRQLLGGFEVLRDSQPGGRPRARSPSSRSPDFRDPCRARRDRRQEPGRRSAHPMAVWPSRRGRTRSRHTMRDAGSDQAHADRAGRGPRPARGWSRRRSGSTRR